MYKRQGKRIKIDGINARKLAIAAITVVYPIAGIAISVSYTHLEREPVY